MTLMMILIAMAMILISSTQAEGFTTALYHRDSPASPIYDPTLSPSERTRLMVASSISRSNHTHQMMIANNPRANIRADPSGGAYLMAISIGTPPVQIVAFADTGSDLIWTQCAPCKNASACFNQTLPLFEPSKSSTFTKIPCNSSSPCHDPASSPEIYCTSQKLCGYDIVYGDESYSRGVMGRDTITMSSSTSGRPVKLPNYIFGCGFESSGNFTGSSGIIGLGGGPESLVSQLGSEIDGIFSYCLADQVDAVSTINFGRNALVTGSGVVKTHLITTEPALFYFLHLSSFTVGNVKIPFALSINEGNIVIDSGTTLVLLPPKVYSQFETEVSKQTSGAVRVPDPTQTGLGLCYKDGPSFKAPNITAHFSGADVKLRKYNLFLRMTPEDDVICLAFAATGFIPIYGNVAQKNFLIGYNKPAATLSFKPTDCAKAVAA